VQGSIARSKLVLIGFLCPSPDALAQWTFPRMERRRTRVGPPEREEAARVPPQVRTGFYACIDLLTPDGAQRGKVSEIRHSSGLFAGCPGPGSTKWLTTLGKRT
jgi:hypothetical protein